MFAFLKMLLEGKFSFSENLSQYKYISSFHQCATQDQPVLHQKPSQEWPSTPDCLQKDNIKGPKATDTEEDKMVKDRLG